LGRTNSTEILLVEGTCRSCFDDVGKNQANKKVIRRETLLQGRRKLINRIRSRSRVGARGGEKCQITAARTGESPSTRPAVRKQKIWCFTLKVELGLWGANEEKGYCESGREIKAARPGGSNRKTARPRTVAKRGTRRRLSSLLGTAGDETKRRREDTRAR